MLFVYLYTSTSLLWPKYVHYLQTEGNKNKNIKKFINIIPFYTVQQCESDSYSTHKRCNVNKLLKSYNL